jgi:hypothetical protein
MNVNFDGILFPASQLLDKTLIARVSVPVYSGSDLGGSPIATVSAGNPIGTIYSYVGGTPGSAFYWMFLRPNGTAYYVKHQNNIFNVSLLQQQGVLSVEQEIEQQQEQQDEFFPGLDLPSFDLGNVAILAGVVLGGLILLNLTKK